MMNIAMEEVQYYINLDLCIITFLPHILDSSEAERETYL
jgi:hypothetical protein